MYPASPFGRWKHTWVDEESGAYSILKTSSICRVAPDFNTISRAPEVLMCPLPRISPLEISYDVKMPPLMCTCPVLLELADPSLI
jgi:hypothetical protein